MQESKTETCFAYTQSNILHGAEGHRERGTQAILKKMHHQQALKAKQPDSRGIWLLAFKLVSYIWESTFGAEVSSKPYSRAVTQRGMLQQTTLGDQQCYGVPSAPAAERCPGGAPRISRNRTLTSGTCWVFIFLLLTAVSYSCVSNHLWCTWCTFFFLNTISGFEEDFK